MIFKIHSSFLVNYGSSLFSKTLVFSKPFLIFLNKAMVFNRTFFTSACFNKNLSRYNINFKFFNQRFKISRSFGVGREF